jgi:hypothetical protein
MFSRPLNIVNYKSELYQPYCTYKHRVLSIYLFYRICKGSKEKKNQICYYSAPYQPTSISPQQHEITFRYDEKYPLKILIVQANHNN